MKILVGVLCLSGAIAALVFPDGGGWRPTSWPVVLFDLGLIAALFAWRKEQVPILSAAIGCALAGGLVGDLAIAFPFWRILAGAAATAFWLLALRVPTPLIILRGDPPFPGSIKSMLAIPFLLWPLLVLFLLAPEMPAGLGWIGWQGVFFAILGGVAVTRIGRVGPIGFSYGVLAVLLLGVSWTLGSLSALSVWGTEAVLMAPAAMVAELLGRASLLASLLAVDGPRISVAALAFAESMPSDAVRG